MVPGALSTVKPRPRARPLRGLTWSSKPEGISRARPVGRAALWPGARTSGTSSRARTSMPEAPAVAYSGSCARRSRMRTLIVSSAVSTRASSIAGWMVDEGNPERELGGEVSHQGFDPEGLGEVMTEAEEVEAEILGILGEVMPGLAGEEEIDLLEPRFLEHVGGDSPAHGG